MNEGRIVPCDPDAEKGVLSAIMGADSTAMLETRSVLLPEDFMLDQHRRLFEVLCDMQESAVPLGLAEVFQELIRLQLTEKLGGAEWLTTNFYDYSAVYRTNLGHHLARVRDLSIRRQVIRSAQILAIAAADQTSPMEESLATFERRTREIGEGNKQQAETIGDIVDEAGGFQNFMAPSPGIGSPWKRLNELTGGFQPGDLVVIGARPSMGKTAIMLEAARHNAGVGDRTAVYSYEMSKLALLKRLISRETHISFTRLLGGDLTKSEVSSCQRAGNRLTQLPLHLVAASGKTTMWVRCHIERLVRKDGLAIAYADYLQRMKPSNRQQNRNLEIGSITRDLKDTASECGIPIVVLSQLSRANESRADKRPQLSDLRESGDIEQDADIVLFLHRAWYYERHREDLKGLAELIIAKQRNGAILPINLAFIEEYGAFESISWEAE